MGKNIEVGHGRLTGTSTHLTPSIYGYVYRYTFIHTYIAIERFEGSPKLN